MSSRASLSSRAKRGICGSTAVTVCAGAIAIAACASQAKAPCEDVPAGVVLMAGVDVHNECAVDRRPRLQVPARIDYRPTVSGGCFKSRYEFVVDSTGVPIAKTVREVQSNDRGLSAAFAAAIPDFRFVPAMRDGRAVAALVIMEQKLQSFAVARVGSGRPPPSAPC